MNSITASLAGAEPNINIKRWNRVAHKLPIPT
jgi:hypothetical protein